MKNNKFLIFLTITLILIVGVIIYFIIIKNDNNDVLDCENNKCYVYNKEMKYMIIDNYRKYLKYQKKHNEDFEKTYDENFFNNKKLVVFEPISASKIITKVENNKIYCDYLNTLNDKKFYVVEIDKSIENSQIEFIMK